MNHPSSERSYSSPTPLATTQHPRRILHSAVVHCTYMYTLYLCHVAVVLVFHYVSYSCLDCLHHMLLLAVKIGEILIRFWELIDWLVYLTKWSTLKKFCHLPPSLNKVLFNPLNLVSFKVVWGICYIPTVPWPNGLINIYQRYTGCLVKSLGHNLSCYKMQWS